MKLHSLFHPQIQQALSKHVLTECTFQLKNIIQVNTQDLLGTYHDPPVRGNMCTGTKTRKGRHTETIPGRLGNGLISFP